jgi:hypothetical protein
LLPGQPEQLFIVGLSKNAQQSRYGERFRHRRYDFTMFITCVTSSERAFCWMSPEY